MKWLKWIGIVAAALVILPLAALLIMGQRSNAGKMRVAVDISAPPEQVWNWIEDGDRFKQWVSWVVDVSYPDPQKVHGVGASRVVTMRDANNGGEQMRIKGQCSEYDPPRRLTMKLSDESGSFDGDQSYHLVDLGNGRTRMEMSMRYHFGQWFARLMEPLITPQAESKARMDLNRLKSLVESRASR